MTIDVDLATVLYRQLPEVYHNRDNSRRNADGSIGAPGDLALLLACYGDLFTGLYRTILQRYYDSFPDQEPDANDDGIARGAQVWALPYIAQLLDVVPLSPLESGQRDEIAKAVAWRQRKGTPAVAEQIAEAVAQLEVEIQEGWRLVAVTPHPGFARLPALSFGEVEPTFVGPVADSTPGVGPVRAAHPGLPNGTVDLRRASRAVRSGPSDPSAHETTFSGTTVRWRQANRHGVPCFPDSFQDVSAHTADLRVPSSRRGYAHPRRVVLHAAPFDGFFIANAAEVQWSDIDDAVQAGSPLPAGGPLTMTVGTDAGVTLRAKNEVPVKLRGVVDLAIDRRWSFENIWFDDVLRLTTGRIDLASCAVRRFESDRDDAVVAARATLFDTLLALNGQVALEYCTVLGPLVADALTASDCILMQMPHKDPAGGDDDVPAAGCIRYTRLPWLPDVPWFSDPIVTNLRVATATCTSDSPVFVDKDFGKRGCGVLHPATPDAIRFGAEDGGEMGAYHELRYTLREQAVLDKLAGFLPIGIEPIFAPDKTLRCAPPAAI